MIPAELDRPIAGLRVATPEGYYWDGLDPEVVAAVRAAVGVLGDLGARVGELALPDPQILNVASPARLLKQRSRVYSGVTRGFASEGKWLHTTLPRKEVDYGEGTPVR